VAYVNFEDRAAAVVALKLNETEFMGRVIRVSRVLKKNKLLALTTKRDHGQAQKRKSQLMDKISKFSTLKVKKSGAGGSGKKTLTKKLRKEIKKRDKQKHGKRKSLIS